MYNGRLLKIEQGIISRISYILSEANIAGKILYISDSVVDRIYGTLVKEQLSSIGNIEIVLIDSNTISYAMTLAERVIEAEIDFIVGLGAGKVLDVCKYAAYISKIPFISIPTTLANDSISSPIAVLKKQDMLPKSLGCSTPLIILIDVDVIMNSPNELIKAGIGDMLSNYMALIDWDYAHKQQKESINGFAYLMSQTSLEILMKTQYESICPEFIHILANSLVLSGIAMDFAGSSRPVSGSEHLFSHALDYYCPVKNLHGIQVALGTIATLKLLKRNYTELLHYLQKFNIRINPAYLGITNEMFIKCMQKAPEMRNNRFTYLHTEDLNDYRLKDLYNELVNEV
jgi:glycerol-1-phosphate dehydrogenase [NAD(P)+]